MSNSNSDKTPLRRRRQRPLERLLDYEAARRWEEEGEEEAGEDRLGGIGQGNPSLSSSSSLGALAIRMLADLLPHERGFRGERKRDALNDDNN